MPAKPVTYVGQKIGKLSVLERERVGRTTYYTCLCECGNTTKVTNSNLTSGAVRSCGCLLLETRGNERQPLKERITKSSLTCYKRNAKDRDYEWSLSDEEFSSLINGDCHYCKIPPSNQVPWRYKYEIVSLPFNGVDRVDNTLGYTIDNCVSCCRTCNSAKGELSLAEFKAWALRLASHL